MFAPLPTSTKISGLIFSRAPPCLSHTKAEDLVALLTAAGQSQQQVIETQAMDAVNAWSPVSGRNPFASQNETMVETIRFVASLAVWHWGIFLQKPGFLNGAKWISSTGWVLDLEGSNIDSRLWG